MRWLKRLFVRNRISGVYQFRSEDRVVHLFVYTPFKIVELYGKDFNDVKPVTTLKAIKKAK